MSQESNHINLSEGEPLQGLNLTEAPVNSEQESMIGEKIAPNLWVQYKYTLFMKSGRSFVDYADSDFRRALKQKAETGDVDATIEHSGFLTLRHSITPMENIETVLIQIVPIKPVIPGSL